MLTLSQAREGIERVHLIAQAAVPIIYLVEIFVVRDVNQSVGPGKRYSRENRRVSPNVERAVVKIGVCMLRNHVSEEVVMGFPGDEYAFLVQVKSRNDRWGGGGNVGGPPGEEVSPLISSKSYMRPDMCKMGGAPSGAKSLGNSPEDVCVGVQVVGACVLLNCCNFLEGGATI